MFNDRIAKSKSIGVPPPRSLFAKNPPRNSTGPSVPQGQVSSLWSFGKMSILAPRSQGGGQNETALQAKLKVNQPGDAYEQEADRVAEQVIRPTPSTFDATRLSVQQNSRGSNPQMNAAPRSVAHTLESPGRPLEAGLRADMEQRFGHDFSRVRVHSGASADLSTNEIHARAYAVGRNIVFGAGEYAPGTYQGRRLIAHELTHVLQQSPSGGNSLVQREVAKAEAATSKLEIAKNKLIAKYGLKDITQEDGATWTTSQLRRVDAELAKMSPEERSVWQGVTLVRIKKIATKKLKGKSFNITGQTFGTDRVELTSAGTRGTTTLHESGHLIHNTAILKARVNFGFSKHKSELESARMRLNRSSRKRRPVSNDQRFLLQHFQAAERLVISTATALERSHRVDPADVQRKRADLEQAVAELPPWFGSKPDAYNQDLRAFADTLLRWSGEEEKAVGSVRGLEEFVSIVKKHKLDRRKFAFFTAYAAANWPEKPREFFSEAYQSWRRNPSYMKKNGRPLYDWFEKGGHLGPSLLDPPIIKALLQAAGDTFLPAVGAATRLIP